MRTHTRRHRRLEWSDAQLIEAAVAGDSAAADILFSRYDRYAWGVAIRYTHTHHAAEEAVAAGRASAFEKMSQLRDPTRFGPWLAAMVKNSAYNEQRRSSRVVPSDDLPEMAFLDDDGDTATSDAERFDRARKALLSLPERHRQAIDMAVFNELPVKEVAAALMIDVNTAYQLLFRARKNLRRAYISTRPHAGATQACKACAAKTLDYLRGNAEVRQEVDAHVATCVGCRTHLAEALDDAREMQPLFGLAPVGLVVAWRELARRHPRLLPRPKIRHAALNSPVTASVCVVATVALVAGGTGYALASGHSAATRFVNAGAAGPPASATPPAHVRTGPSRTGIKHGSTEKPASSTIPATSSSSSSSSTTSSSTTIAAASATTLVPATTVPALPATASTTSAPAAVYPASESGLTTNPTTPVPPTPTTSPATTTAPATTGSTTTITTSPTTAPPPARPWTTQSGPGSGPRRSSNPPEPVPTTLPAPRIGTFLTGDGTTVDSGTAGTDATWSGGAGPVYGPGPTAGTQAFSFVGGTGLSDAGIQQLAHAGLTVSFDLKTSQSTGTTGIDLLGYRTSCDVGDFFDVRLESARSAPGSGSGHLLVELAQLGGSPVDLRSPATSAPLDDGAWHQIQIAWAGDTVTLTIDGQSQGSVTVPAGASYTNGSPWQVASGDVCDGATGDGTLPLDGEMANIFVGPTSSAADLP